MGKSHPMEGGLAENGGGGRVGLDTSQAKLRFLGRSRRVSN